MQCPFSRFINGNLCACGKCEVCKDNKRRGYVVRLQIARQFYINTYFITLTFNEERYNDNRDYMIRAFQLFMKRLRKQNKIGHEFKYFSVLERGELNHRFHWHMLLFTNLRCSKEEILQYILDAWQNGICDVGYLRDGGIPYVCKYLFKDEYKMLISRGLGFQDYSQPEVLDAMTKRLIHIDGFNYSIPESIKSKMRRSNRELYYGYFQEFKPEVEIDKKYQLLTDNERMQIYRQYLIDKEAQKQIK